MSLIAEHQCDRATKIHLAIVLRSKSTMRCGANQAIAPFTNIFECRIFHDAHVEHRTRGGANHLGIERIDRSCSQHDPRRPCGLCRTNDRAEIAGIGDPIGDHHPASAWRKRGRPAFHNGQDRLWSLGTGDTTHYRFPESIHLVETIWPPSIGIQIHRMNAPTGMLRLEQQLLAFYDDEPLGRAIRTTSDQSTK